MLSLSSHHPSLSPLFQPPIQHQSPQKSNLSSLSLAGPSTPALLSVCLEPHK